MSKSFFKLREGLIWETEEPSLNVYYTSPVFSFRNSKWLLRLSFFNPCKKPSYNLSLIYSDDHAKIIEKFIVKTCFIRDKYNDTNVLEDRSVFEHTVQGRRSTQLWKLSMNNIFFIYPDNESHAVFTIACAFYGTNGCILPVTIEEELKAPSSDTGRSCEPQNPSSSNLNSPLNLDNLSQDFSKLLNEKLMTDVQIVCGEHTFQAHKLILSARSNVFATMFQNKMAESKSGIINVKDVDASVMDMFLKYLYSGKIDDDLPEDIVFKLYEAGDKYAVYGLMKMCSNYMVNNLTEENFLIFLTLADVHSDGELQNAVADFVTERGELLRKDNWISFSQTHSKVANQIYQRYIEFLCK